MENQHGNTQSTATTFIDRPTRGVIVPLITPLVGRDELDVDGLERLVEHVLDGGVHGLFLLGTCGESAALCSRVRRDLVSRVCRQVGGRVPVLVGISDTALVESLRLAEDVANAGAAAVVVTTPYYLPLEPSELINYIRTVSEESPLPVFLYNMPELARSWFSIPVLTELLDLDNVIGLKDSSGDDSYFEAAKVVMARRPDWSLLIGTEARMGSAVRGGAHGSVPGGANVYPRLFANIYDAALANDETQLSLLQEQVVELSQIYQYGGYAVGTIRGIKSALKQLSIASDKMAAPFLGPSEPQQKAIAACLNRLGLLNGRPAHTSSTLRFDGIERAAAPRRMYGSSAPANPAAWIEKG
jgi:4-hydroxy-tetrahydrodipicolinate synthase